MSALSLASLGVLCENKPLGMASLGVICEATVTVLPLGQDTAEGRSHETVIINVMARPEHFAPVALKAKSLLEPAADANIEFDFTDFALPQTSSKYDVKADASALVGKILQPKLEIADTQPRASAVVINAEGASAAVEYSWAVPKAEAITTLQGHHPVITSVLGEFKPITIKNPTEEELIALIRAARKRRTDGKLTRH